MQEKQAYRQALLKKRATITAEQRAVKDRAIVEAIAASALFQNATQILLYAPVRGEIDLLPLISTAREQGKAVGFPRCDLPSNTLEFYLLEPDAVLTAGAYHIPEPPADAPLCVPDESTLCILPALTFDLSGARLGYGKGYYDRFLEHFPGICIGAIYSELLVKQVPTEPHDLPVSHLFTEQGMLTCLPRKATEQARASKPESKPQKAFLARILQRVSQKNTAVVSQTEQEASQDTPTATRAHAPHLPPILVATTFVLLLLSRLIDTHLTTRDNEYAVVILLQLLIFLVPAMIYGKLRGERFAARIRVALPRPEHLWFTFCILVVMISAGLLCDILTGGISSLTGNFTLYDTFVARLNGGVAETIYVVLAYALLPAFCEELIFRSILCAEYERFGVAVSITVSALFFAMLHFSLSLFLTYLVLGALLSAAMYATRSFFTAVILHAFYNLFCLFGQPYLSAFYVRAGSNEIFLFCLILVFLLFAAFAAGEARKIYHVYAKNNADSSYTTATPIRQLPHSLLSALRSPAVIACLVIWLVASIAALI